MRKYSYVVIDTSTYEGDDESKATRLQGDLTKLGDSGFRFVTTFGPLFVMESDYDVAEAK